MNKYIKFLAHCQSQRRCSCNLWHIAETLIYANLSLKSPVLCCLYKLEESRNMIWDVISVTCWKFSVYHDVVFYKTFGICITLRFSSILNVRIVMTRGIQQFDGSLSVIWKDSPSSRAKIHDLYFMYIVHHKIKCQSPRHKFAFANHSLKWCLL